ncbi:MAG: peptidase M23 [Dictyoglomus sp. NZ13-RE01]|nr:MAG: peptidase M23 [Dictyoglomus sp. NZ13-RE01]
MKKRRRWWKRFFTLIIIPHDSSHPRSHKIHISIPVLILIILIGTLAFSFALYKISTNKLTKVKHLEVLEEVSEQQKAQLKELDKLREKIKEIEEVEKKLKQVLGIKGSIPTPQKNVSFVPLDLKTYKDVETFQNEKKILEYKLILEEKERSLAYIQKEIERRKALLAVTPSRWPAWGFISSGFGWRFHPIFRRREFHSGIDIVSFWGAPVYATADGFVTYAGWESGYGKVIKINHGRGISTLYAHLSYIKVNVGSYVKKGQLIGLIGSTGTATGPHLHYEVRRNGVAVNPTPYLNVDIIKLGYLK